MSVALALAACGGEDGDAAQQSAASPSPAGAGNQAPTITGAAQTAVMQGTLFDLLPTADDPDDDTLSFSIVNKPSWATFNAANGRLRGTPGAADLGMYSDVEISVSDGELSASLPAFDIEVVATALGSATLTWNAPTQRSDGSALSDLAGFRIYWGTSEGNYSNSTTLNGAGITIYVVDQLTPATWYFVATALDSQGMESQFSNVASKTVL